MSTSTYKSKLLDLKSWYEGWADRLAERATQDSQSNFEFRLASAGLAAVEHNLRRIDRGRFGRCEACGAIIPDERLDVLLESDNHWCTQCAATHGKPAQQHMKSKPTTQEGYPSPMVVGAVPA